MGDWGQQTQTIIYRTDKQGPTVQKKKLYSISCDNTVKEYEKIVCIYLYV